MDGEGAGDQKNRFFRESGMNRRGPRGFLRVGALPVRRPELHRLIQGGGDADPASGESPTETTGPMGPNLCILIRVAADDMSAIDAASGSV